MVWNIQLGIMIPSDELIFFRGAGRLKPPTSVSCYVMLYHSQMIKLCFGKPATSPAPGWWFPVVFVDPMLIPLKYLELPGLVD